MSALWILLPGYNVAEHLPDLLPRVRDAQPDATILLVDDGSSDATAAVAESAGILVHRHERNQGKGVALRTGFDLALAGDARAVITMDSDAQHDPREAQRFVDAWSSGAQVVVGNRMGENREMPWLRARTNEFTSSVISSLVGQRIPDSQNGYRLFDRAVLEAIPLESERYDLESEILIKAGALGFRIDAVPVSTIYGDEVSAIHPVQDTLRFVQLVRRARRWRREMRESRDAQATDR